MRRRINLEPNINHERWLVSYADFVTLLFAFFVVMYSISQVSEQKYRELSEMLDVAFTSPSLLTAKRISNEGVASLSSEVVGLTNLREDIMNSLSYIASPDHVTITGNESWTEIALDAELIFGSGEAEISDEAKRIFLELADTLSPYDNEIAVAGHTDNLPINNSRFSNNWDLSSARAVSVVRLLSSHGIEPQRLSAIGYGEFRPVVSNDTVAGRNKNRRVVLRVNHSASKIADTTFDLDGNEINKASFSNVGSEGAAPNHREQEDLHQKKGVAPVILEDGSLLFTSDPDLPRMSNPIASPPPN